MPDYSILELQQLFFGQAWYAVQWWASVSFGLMALTRFSGKHLNLTIVIALSIIYSLFTVFTVANLQMLVTGLAGMSQDLIALRESGSLGVAGERLLDFRQRYAPLNGRILLLCIVVTYVGTLWYLIYTFRKPVRSM